MSIFAICNMEKYSGLLLLEDGTTWNAIGYGHEGIGVGELCFNTSMTGYQEIVSDPSYAEQIITFTFPHIGNTGTNNEDNESHRPMATGVITRAKPTAPSSWRNQLSNEEIKVEILKMIEAKEELSIKDMGKIMGELKVNFSGRMDFGKASEIVKALLK